MGQRKEQWDKAAYYLDEAKEIWGNVAGTINYMDLGFKARKPDWKKLDAAMKKANKPAKFFMTMNGLVYTFEVHVGSTKLVMNKVDIGKVRGASKQREILRKLSLRTKVVTKEDLAKFDREHADPEDGEAAVEIGEQVTRLQNEIDLLRQTARAANYRRKEITKGLFMNKEFKAWAKKKGYSGFVDFLIDVDDDKGFTPAVVAFLETGKRTGMRTKTLEALKDALERGEKPDFEQARKEVAHVVNKAMLPKYNKEKLGEIAEEIKKREAAIKKLERRLEALKAA